MNEEKERQLYVITHPKCPGCKNAKRQLDQKGVPYKVLNLNTSDMAVDILRELGIKSVPTMLVRKESDVCSLDDTGDVSGCVKLLEGEGQKMDKEAEKRND